MSHTSAQCNLLVPHLLMTSTSNPSLEQHRIKLTMDFTTNDAQNFKSYVKKTLKSLRLGCEPKKHIIQDKSVTKVIIEGEFNEIHRMKTGLFAKIKEKYPMIQIPEPITETSYEPFNSYNIRESTLENITNTDIAKTSSGRVSNMEEITPFDSASNTGGPTMSEMQSWICHFAHILHKMFKTIVTIE